MQNFSLIQLAAEGILMLHYNPSVIYKNIILFKKDRQFAKQIWTHGP